MTTSDIATQAQEEIAALEAEGETVDLALIYDDHYKLIVSGADDDVGTRGTGTIIKGPE